MINYKKELNNFITDIIDRDLKSNNNLKIITRFPPEPNGYLHIGHAKSIFLNFGIALKYGGKCNLRFDDTNPTKENIDYVNSIIEDVSWLIGSEKIGKILYASDYFDQMYQYALDLIKKGLAYVDDQNMDEIKKNRGDYQTKGINSPCRNRTIEENSALFKQMKNGDFKNGEKVLRAKIDMNAKNINMRDPIMYRILHAEHHRTKNDWCIYPMYDWAHGLEDSIEKITHSLCTLEFEDHRPLYDWYLQSLDIYHPQQIEFARLNLSYTVVSKRKLKRLVDEELVDGWDDPRMPTISGLRRRGYSPESIRNFSDNIGVTKRDSIVDISKLENSLREDLNKRSLRVMAVLDPIKIIITNYPEDRIEYLDAINNPEDNQSGKRKLAFSKELFIERSDFMEDPPKKFFRLAIGKEVRLKFAYYVTCNKVVKDKNGLVQELHCTYDPNTKGGRSEDGRKVRGTIHWVSSAENIMAKVHLYDRLFMNENPEVNGDFIKDINQKSLIVVDKAYLEKSMENAKDDFAYQFERTGYFIKDNKYSDNNKFVFNRAVSMRDSWAKINKNLSK